MDNLDTALQIIFYVLTYVVIFLALMLTVRGAAYIRETYYDHWHYVVIEAAKRYCVRASRRLSNRVEKLILDPKASIETINKKREKIEKYSDFVKRHTEVPQFYVTQEVLDFTDNVMDLFDEVVSVETVNVMIPEIAVLKDGERINVLQLDVYVKKVYEAVVKSFRPEIFTTNTVYSQEYMLKYIAQKITVEITAYIDDYNRGR